MNNIIDNLPQHIANKRGHLIQSYGNQNTYKDQYICEDQYTCEDQYIDQDAYLIDNLPQQIANKRGGGGLMQLIAYGASDVYLTGITGNPQCYNIRNSMIHYFINHDDGLPVKEDLDIDNSRIFEHYPEYIKPSTNTLVSFNINKERSCVKIQRAWRKRIGNPPYTLCKV
jgi:hypothetical protein